MKVNNGGKNMSKIGCRMFQAVMRLGMCFIKYREPVMLTGENSTGEIGKIFKRHQISCVLLVTDKGIVSKNLHQSSLEALKKNNIKCVIYDKTVPNPTIDNIEEGLKMYLENACQGILTIGGGSAMDCAKGIGARVANPKKSISQMRGILKVTHKIPILVAVPTTAGTGSETTLAAVITDSTTHEKYAINDPKLIPHYAVLDPVLTLSLPPSLTASTGMDAFVHAIEAYIGKSNTKNTEKNAELATRLIIENLQKAFDDGKNLEAREKMQQASFFAGVAFSRAYVGNVHAIAHTLGGQYQVPHGFANAVILPYVLKYYGKTIYNRIDKLCRKVGFLDDIQSKQEKTEKFIEYIESLNKKFGFPDKIDELKEEDIETLAKRADKEANPLYPVPMIFSLKDFENIYRMLLKK